MLWRGCEDFKSEEIKWMSSVLAFGEGEISVARSKVYTQGYIYSFSSRQHGTIVRQATAAGLLG